jgi:hypothetical protein
MQETTQQRNSRIAMDDSAAHRTFNHARDFFAGLATYEIKPDTGKSFSIAQITPKCRLSGWAKNYEIALAKIEAWKNEEICCGYHRSQFGE